MQSAKRIESCSTICVSYHTLGSATKGCEIPYEKVTCNSIFRAAQSIIVKTCKPARCLWKEEWIHNFLRSGIICCLFIYFTMKNTEILNTRVSGCLYISLTFHTWGVVFMPYNTLDGSFVSQLCI